MKVVVTVALHGGGIKEVVFDSYAEMRHYTEETLYGAQRYVDGEWLPYDGLVDDEEDEGELEREREGN